MRTLAWDRRFATGLPALDGEHKVLFREVRRIQGRLEPGGDFVEGRRLLAALLVHLEGHCASEEAEMARLGFPGLEAHRASHRVLRQRLDGVRALLAEGSGASGMAISRLLYDWLRDHMLQDDLNFAAFLRARARPEA
ncbi:MAG: hemerythrin family protein [Holophagaceae bacterium]